MRNGKNWEFGILHPFSIPHWLLSVSFHSAFRIPHSALKENPVDFRMVMGYKEEKILPIFMIFSDGRRD